MAEPIYEIVRSFSKTVQIKQFQPESHFCSVKEVFYDMPTDKEKLEKSKELYDFVRLEVLKSVYPKSMTVEEFESLSAREQADLQDIKRAKGREKYAEDKKLGHIKRFPCNVCNEDHPITQKKCVELDSVEGVGAERGSKYESI